MNLTTSGLLLAAITLSQLTLAAELQQLSAHVGGRTSTSTNSAGELSYEYSWPSVYFETAFKGDSLTLKFDDDQNIFQLIIDGGASIIINKPGKQDYVVPGLTTGTHSVRLEKITETQSSTGRFHGFYSDDKPADLAKRKRRIEFIGDSFTVGYGNTSSSRECTTEEVYATTNSQLSFGPLVAKHFNADYQINASSGFGIVRNYNGTSPDKSLLKLYPYTLVTPNEKYSGKWQPQIIMIGLGTNDFSTPLNANERWKTRTDLQNDYVANYVGFVKGLHQQHPKTQFILMASDQMEGELATQINKVVAALKADGVKKIDSIIFKGLDYQGCHWHPSVKDDQLLAGLLIDYVESNKLW